MNRRVAGRFTSRAAFVSALLLAGTSLANAAGDAAKGADVFKRCQICHSSNSGGGNKIGPNLFGIVGRPAGTAPGYSYSPAMKNSGLTWTEANLTEYLTDPKGKVPSNKMSFAGISNQTQLADLIAYLATLK